VVNLVVRHNRLNPAELVKCCLSDLINFTQGAKQTDDLTLLVIRRRPDAFFKLPHSACSR
jgi:serine phosphatase RsbU (regulator of sigma subunit)